jgi:hypothetical protein
MLKKALIEFIYSTAYINIFFKTVLIMWLLALTFVLINDASKDSLIIKSFSKIVFIRKEVLLTAALMILDFVTLIFPIMIILGFFELGIIVLNEELILAFIFLGFDVIIKF